MINLQDEWKGPVKAYAKYGIEQLRLPTIDHVEPTVDDMERAVAFIRRVRATADERRSEQRGVLIHCKGGHGRSEVSQADRRKAIPPSEWCLLSLLFNHSMLAPSSVRVVRTHVRRRAHSTCTTRTHTPHNNSPRNQLAHLGPQ